MILMGVCKPLESQQDSHHSHQSHHFEKFAQGKGGCILATLCKSFFYTNILCSGSDGSDERIVLKSTTYSRP
jgi:hypothetical protein